MYGLGLSLFYMHVYRMYTHFPPPPNTVINRQLHRVYVIQSEYESMYGLGLSLFYMHVYVIQSESMYGLGLSLFYMHVYRMYRHFPPPPNTVINTQLHRVHVYVIQSEYESTCMYGLGLSLFYMHVYVIQSESMYGLGLSLFYIHVIQSDYESMYGFESILHACIYRMYTHTHNDIIYLTCYR